MDKARAKINGSGNLTVAEKMQQLTELNQLACAKVKCAEGVSENDPRYEEVKARQDKGDALVSQGADILETLAELDVEATKTETVYARSMTAEVTTDEFQYDVLADSIDDGLTSNEKTVARLQQTGEVVAGGLEVAGAGALCTTGIGCAASVAVGTLGTATIASGVVGLTSEHEYAYGQKVLDSFQTSTHQGENNPLADATVDAALTVAGGATGKAIERNADQIGDSLGVLKDKVVGSNNAKIDKPIDHYDPNWKLYNKQNPEELKSVGAAAKDSNVSSGSYQQRTPDGKFAPIDADNSVKPGSNLELETIEMVNSIDYLRAEPQVRFNSSESTRYSVPDMVVVDERFNVPIAVIECKECTGRKSPQQREVFPQIESGTAIPTGNNAKQAGFKTGVDLNSGDNPGKLPVLVNPSKEDISNLKNRTGEN